MWLKNKKNVIKIIIDNCHRFVSDDVTHLLDVKTSSSSSTGWTRSFRVEARADTSVHTRTRTLALTSHLTCFSGLWHGCRDSSEVAPLPRCQDWEHLHQLLFKVWMKRVWCCALPCLSCFCFDWLAHWNKQGSTLANILRTFVSSLGQLVLRGFKRNIANLTLNFLS